MLDDYKNIQPIAYSLLKNSIISNKFSHAYIFESNGNSYEYAIAFAKSLLCPSHYTSCQDNKCNICNRIDNGNYSEITILEPEGLWIKKNQIVDLQNAFSRKPVEGELLLYIIKDCDRLNETSANTILKFLEEPEEGIVAILLTSNTKKVIKTILSRCQVIRFKETEENQLKKVEANSKMSSDEFDQLKRMCFEFVSEYENKGYNVIVNTTELFEYLDKKESLQNFFEIILLIYSDILNLNMFKSNIYFENSKWLNLLSDKLSIGEITAKIDIILDIKEKANSNLNSRMIFDKFLIRMDGVKNA